MGSTAFISSVSTQFFFQSCWKCGVVWGMTQDLTERRRSDGLNVYCPNGHYGTFGESEEDKLKKQVERERRLRVETENNLYVEKEYSKNLRNQKRAMKGASTKLKKRIAAGVCPCCNRTFQNVARHMNNKHPGYTKVSK